METNTPNPLISQPDLTQQRLYLMTRIKNGTGWFYWIAGLSLINTIIYLFGGSISFVFGLAITQIVDVITSATAQGFDGNLTLIVRIVGFVIDLFIAGIFVMLGFLGQKRFRWVVVIGMVFYFIDALICLWAQDWFSAAFHAWALWNLWQGLQAMNTLNALEKSIEQPIPTFQ